MRNTALHCKGLFWVTELASMWPVVVWQVNQKCVTPRSGPLQYALENMCWRTVHTYLSCVHIFSVAHSKNNVQDLLLFPASHSAEHHVWLQIQAAAGSWTLTVAGLVALSMVLTASVSLLHKEASRCVSQIFLQPRLIRYHPGSPLENCTV